MIEALPAVIQAGADIFSAFSASHGQKVANEAQMDFNSAEAQKDRDFQERMSSTSFQRARRDLEAAGYNPLLALGHGASTPSGASASISPKSETELSSSLISGSAQRVADISLNQIMKRKMESEASTAKSQAMVADADAKAYTAMPFLAKVKAVMQSISGLGGILGGAGVGAMLRNITSAKQVSGGYNVPLKWR